MDTLTLIRSYHTYNFIKNLKSKISSVEKENINNEYLKAIENIFTCDDVLDDIVIALLNYIWPTQQERIRNNKLKKFVKHVLKVSNSNKIIYISSIYYLLNLKDNNKYNNLLQRIQQEIENTKQEQGFLNNNIYERCCPCCGAYISCYKSETIVCKCRLFLTSLILASKFGQDKNYSTKAWSKISSFTVENINYNERFFLNLVDYKLYISVETFSSFISLISNHIVSMENQKKKMKCQELMNLAKLNAVNNNTQEYKKLLLLKRLKQLEILKQAKAKSIKRQLLQSKGNIQQQSLFINTSVNNLSSASALNLQKLSPVESDNNESRNHYLSPSSSDNQSPTNIQTINITDNINCNGNHEDSPKHNIAAISPISPSDQPFTNANINVNINSDVNNDNKLNIYTNYILNNKTSHHYNNVNNVMPKVFNIYNKTYSDQQRQGQAKIEKRLQPNVTAQKINTGSEKLTLSIFSSFINFYNCISSKLSSADESILKGTKSYKILSCAMSLACSKRVQDSLRILNHTICSTMDICKDILSLALKGHKETALIYINLLTPSEIQFYNNNLRAPNLNPLTPNDVLSVVSILLNCVQKNSTQPTDIINDLLASISNQNQINISKTQNLLLTFIQNINYNLRCN
ncbi:hypothetical protein BCR32DRAFT_269203 [Anaeromyces robustus]|uniref:Cyclin N-terminal domain-containing protein n=1 Tax=Anaeromyces robustus TaxID=1754192 RepID=A0A1Y1X243_9FUNG|nr:hypothetical protein BCR32DRAFT_269203 [Anaeromyces robustus]|eukprot:ORX79843.1 hypothetical protein BCR32DRAFT_269203 [Anaeromyces robustus]